ncbi:MAG: hypothetical protein HYV09_25265 [Deltaproteobacteria bacterium]|nr:hypothetical protein [Deltaproteobacteria bacterium]
MPAYERLADDTTTPVVVCGVLAGLAGGVLGMIPSALVALARGEGLGYPSKLVAASLMGREALANGNALGASMLGALMTVVASSAAGAAFTWLRRREARFKLLVAEGIGFGLVLFGLLWAALPLLDATMAERPSMAALAVSYALFGASLSLQLPLRIGSFDVTDADRVRASLDEVEGL